MSSGHHNSTEHRLWRKRPQLNSDTDASNEMFLKEKGKKKKHIFQEQNEIQKLENMKNGKKEMKNMKAGVTLKWAFPDRKMKNDEKR